MKYKRRIPSLVLMFVSLVSLPLTAQNTLDSGDEVLERIRVSLLTPFMGSQLNGLAELESNLAQGGIEPSQAVDFLELVLIPSSTEKDFTRPYSVSMPTVRIKALDVLSGLEGSEAESLLIRVLAEEMENTVVEAGLMAAREILREPSEAFQATLVRIMKDPFPNAPHDRTMMEAINTIVWFQQRGGGLATRAIFDGLVYLAEHPRYLQVVRRSANEALRLLINSSR